MRTATFHSLRGQSSALLMVHENEFLFSAVPVYCPRTAVQGLVPGDTLTIPDNLRIVDFKDKDGNPRTSTSGARLKTFAL